MRYLLVLCGACALAACDAAPPAAPVAPPADVIAQSSVPTPRQAAANFVAVVDQVEPVAERICRERTSRVLCDYQILVDGRPELPANAFQTLDPNGRPVIAFTIALIADARNKDELAFILGHEAAHHIAGHIPRSQDAALRGALLAGVLATIGGAEDENTIRDAQDIGASVGARAFSKEFELEADALGAVIAHRAGFDPVRGAEYFRRIDDPGNQFLGTHPPNAERIATVRQVAAGLK